MKRNIMLLCAALVILMSACHWFNSTSSKTPANSLAGVWVLDSLQVNDSLNNQSRPMINGTMKDSGTLSYQFNKDGSFEAIAGKDSVKGTFTVSKDTLNLHADSTLQSFAFSFVSDSLLQLMEIDSATLLLRRKL